MAERRIIVDNKLLEYEGIFNFQDFYYTMDKWLREKGYDKWEKRNFEQVLKDGRQIEIAFEPWKKITDYARIVLKMGLVVTKMKDIVVKKNGQDIKMNHGKIKMKFIGYLDTDYEHRWEGKPYFYFLRTVLDKYVYRSHTDKYDSAVAEECSHLYNTLRNFLNMYKTMGIPTQQVQEQTG